MIVRKAFKFRLKTNAEIKNGLSRFSGSVRFVWNKALALQKERMEKKERLLSGFAAFAMTTLSGPFGRCSGITLPPPSTEG